jgi:hypothetical protein
MEQKSLSAMPVRAKDAGQWLFQGLKHQDLLEKSQATPRLPAEESLDRCPGLAPRNILVWLPKEKTVIMTSANMLRLERSRRTVTQSCWKAALSLSLAFHLETS